MREPVYTRDYACSIDATVDIIGGKWKTHILFYLFASSSPMRFNELRRILPDVSQRILTQQLRELEQDDIIHREIYKEIPPKVEYSLTEFGNSLKPIIMQMHHWGEQYRERFGNSTSHC